MKVKVLIIFFSMIGATFLVSGGYGYWEKTLKITGEIEVLPDPDLHPKQAEISTPSKVDDLITSIQENVTQENSDVISPQSNEENKAEEMNGVINEKQTVTEGKDMLTQEVSDKTVESAQANEPIINERPEGGQLPTADDTDQALYREGVNPSLPEAGEQK